MKRILSFLLVCLLVMNAVAQGEDAGRVTGAPRHITGEFRSNTGKTRISVDADILLPEAQVFHRYEVQERLFTLEEIQQAADLLFGAGGWKLDPLSHPDQTELSLRKDVNNFGTFYDCYLCSMDHEAYLNFMYSVVDIYGQDYHHWNGIIYGMKRGNTSRQLGTAEEALALADRIVGALWPDMQLDSVDPEKKNLSGRVEGKYGYRLHYTRYLEGASVTHTYTKVSSSMSERSYTPPLHSEQLYVDVGADGIISLNYDHPIQIVGLLEENVTLLPFEQIWEIFGTIAPLTIARYESHQNNALIIDRIELGYMCVQLRDNPLRYQLIPVWDFFGARTIGKDRYKEHNDAQVTINAIDGTIIDRNLGY